MEWLVRLKSAARLPVVTISKFSSRGLMETDKSRCKEPEESFLVIQLDRITRIHQVSVRLPTGNSERLMKLACLSRDHNSLSVDVR